jgi:hypothetical protein
MTNFPAGVSENHPHFAGTTSRTIGFDAYHDCNITDADGEYLAFDERIDVEVEIAGDMVYIDWTCPVCKTEVNDERDADELFGE